MKERNTKPQLSGGHNLSRQGRGGTWQVAESDRRYLPQDIEKYFFDSPAHRYIFSPLNRTRKTRETLTQTIHLGGSSSILFLVLTLLCVLGFILFTQKVLVGATSMRNWESNEVQKLVTNGTTAVEYFGEE